ncbi:hypothetical protein DDE82_008722 [Stemphylium lycopersici]|nr:hypothetical protein DDE82_008722 [Stemphylium lycopersici]
MLPSSDATAYVYHHVVLPPKTPQADDRCATHDRTLLEIVSEALKALKNYVKSEHTEAVMAAIATVENLYACRDERGHTNQLALQVVLDTLKIDGTIGAVPIEVSEQNAGVLVSRGKDSMTFEFFELSPTNEAAMCPGRLRRVFPGHAASITMNKIASNRELLQSISSTLAKMTTQKVPSFQPQIKKNGKVMSEERDTTDPGMVTDFYMNTIAAFGEPTDVQRITKNTREEVLWSNCLSPWRRSPLWLLVRVSLHLLFSRQAPDTLPGDGLYKAFMIFMLSRMLALAKQDWKDLGNEPVHVISAKLTRRLRKFKLLEQTQFLKPSWTQHVETGMRIAHDFIDKNWQELVRNTQGNITTSAIAGLKPELDLDVSLPELDAFLSQMISRKPEVNLSTFTPTSVYPTYQEHELPNSLAGPEDYKYFRLAAFEQWVEHHLSAWTESHMDDGNVCERLRKLMSNYHDLASTAYDQAPIAISIMYLTLAELWISCDRCACATYPMLTEYDPEVDLTEFQSLLLPLKSQMKRLDTVEHYVQLRRRQASSVQPSVYRQFGDLSSFAVRYFDQSVSLQATLRDIENDAAIKRMRKCQELASLKNTYRQYMRIYDSTSCEYRTVVTNRYHGYTKQKHSGNCHRCAAKFRAQQLTISIYEWPLPSVTRIAKATVFELQIPEAFSNWRDASYYFINNILGCRQTEKNKPRCSYALDNHKGLSSMLSSQYRERRILLLSEIKSHTTTHRNQMSGIPDLNENDVCLDNALQYRYYDKACGRFITEMSVPKEKVSKKCLYHMPKRSKALERYMYRLPSLPHGLPANEVILKQRVAASTDEGQRTELLSRATEIALLCTSTYDVEEDDFDTILKHDSAISTLVQSSITIQENRESVQSECHSLLKTMIQSWSRLMYRILPTLRSCVLTDGEGLSDAITANWTAFKPSSHNPWNSLDGHQEHWVETTSDSLSVHFNLLNGELLVNGLPLSRLPSEYMLHEIYETLFQKSALEVVPTSEAGMHFSAKAAYHNYKLHFGMKDRDMLVVAVGGDTKLDLIPSRTLLCQLPHSFLTDYVHWFDHKRDEVIFRRRQSPWNCAEEGWRLIRNAYNKTWRLVNGSEILISLGSRSVRLLSRLLQPIEEPKHAHFKLDTATKRINIELPRLHLGFFVERGERTMQSSQHRGMVIDEIQSIGTLVGLSSKLVLKKEETAERIVLIPVPRNFGATGIIYTNQSDSVRHPVVSINKEEAFKVYAYTIDSNLGRLLDSAELQSRLFLSYLHALTSGVLTDPLTARTGTESSLDILQSAAVRSFDTLTQKNVELLGCIAGLSAKREWYPKNLRVMQRIEWNKRLPSLSQHGSFRELASNLLRQATTMRLFHPDNDIFDTIDQAQKKMTSLSNKCLDERDKMRSGHFRIAGFGAEIFTSSQDQDYQARDRAQNERGRQAFVIATLALRDGAPLHSLIRNLQAGLLQRHFGNATVCGPDTNFDPRTLGYDAEWLDDASQHLTTSWCTLNLSLPNAKDRYNVATWLSTMAFAQNADMDALQTLVAIWRLPELSWIQPPTTPKFHLFRGDKFKSEEIEMIIRSSAKSFDDSAEMRLPKTHDESDTAHESRVESLFNDRQNNAIQRFTNDLKAQGYTINPRTPSAAEYETYLRPSTAMPKVQQHFEEWFNNHRFLEYLGKLSDIMARQAASGVSSPSYRLALPQQKNCLGDGVRHVSIADVFAVAPPLVCRNSATNPASLIPPCEPEVTIAKDLTDTKHSLTKDRLEDLCQRLLTYAKSKCEREYVEHLRLSCEALEGHTSNKYVHKDLVADASSILQEYLLDCQRHFADINAAFGRLFADNISFQVQHSPRISPTFWLSQLHRDVFGSLSDNWKEAILEYALAVTSLQRAQRLAHLSTKPVELVEELQHVGHSNWDVHEFPETLLLEAESGILVRKEQEFIASQMRSPENGQNIVLQLLMGAKLGGMLGRRVYQMPFSRNLRLNTSDARTIRQIYEECISNRGVLLIQPEHILSFKLMAIECVLTDQKETSRSLLSTQAFFDKVSVDCVDESDENFSVKFELIYTMGEQQSIEFAPERWSIIQDVLSPLARVAAQVKEELPEAVNIQDVGDGKYPRIRFLRNDAANRCLHLLAKAVFELGIGVPTRLQSPAMQDAIFRYITETDLNADDIKVVENSKFWTEATKAPLLLLRGLFAGGVLRFVFASKRYRVNFGLDHFRVPNTSLAVPYRSKDAPSPRSEFSHPDVVIILTLLSYYYGGLADNELFDTFVHLLKSDQSVIHYDDFVSTASSSLPKAFKQLSGISIKDRHQCITEVFPHLRHSKKAIDYYLSYLVFPKQLKQFPEKLSASGWDLAIKKPHPTTGFSGTNDTLHLLPLDIKHLDLPSQHHTNAQVLSYLLMDETLVETLPVRKTGAAISDGEHLLNFVGNLNTDVRVLLDCGASILEQNNRQVAETWLKMRDSDIEAVVYFEDEELSVLDRNSRIELFQTSPYAKMLGSCIIYLDEAHTRGTDLKLPRHYRAALTLGSQLSKDRLTQAAMRMRKLGHGQAITFVVPEEIGTKIYELTGKQSGTAIEVPDVLAWAIGETWTDLKKSLPLWAVQGERFERHKHLLSGADTTKDAATGFLENEAVDLETRYKPRIQDTEGFAQLSKWDLSNPRVGKIVSRCRDFEAMGFGSAALSEEQERELAPEIEEERQIERPPRLKAHPQSVHADLKRLVTTGEFSANSTAWEPAFQTLRTTSAGRLIKLNGFPDGLLATVDFTYTVQVPPGSNRDSFISDSYQRPVQFILSVPDPRRQNTIRNLIIISPHEANELAPLLRQHQQVTLHLFAPRANASFPSLDELTLYNTGREFFSGSVSRSLTMQLNLFAGSLYLRSLVEYSELCRHLGLLEGKATEDQQVYADGFIDPPAGVWGLKESPVPFLRVLLMKIRREGEGVQKTHMGKLLNGVGLEEEDFKGAEQRACRVYCLME